jgi:hypothetical protein
MITTPSFFDSIPRALVVGPGIASARSNSAASSRWQKYCDRNSSGRQMTRAPRAAACSMRSTAARRFAPASVPMRIWTMPIAKRLVSAGEVNMVAMNDA